MSELSARVAAVLAANEHPPTLARNPATGEWEAVSPWRAIETAPRDGTTVLLWAPHWSTPLTGWTFGADSWQDARKDTDEKPPTHWMSLPEPPPS